ncbi:Tetratricopeptide repeat protein [uncultured archaeon]|nr:Tetratricopeptide repeat protein [uncultured archaeon]
MILELASVTSLGTCSYCGWGNCPTLTERQQQCLWEKEVFNFLYCDCCDPGWWPYSYRTPSSSQSTAEGTASYWLNEGNGFYLAGSYEKAAASYAEALKLNPYLSEGWLNMGNALYFQGKYPESLDAYNNVLGLDPQNINGLKGKSQALLALNRTSEANAALESLKKLQSRKILQVGSSSSQSTVKPTVVGDFTL